MWGNLGVNVGGLVGAAISNVRKIGQDLENELNDAVGADDCEKKTRLGSLSPHDTIPDAAEQIHPLFENVSANAVEIIDGLEVEADDAGSVSTSMTDNKIFVDEAQNSSSEASGTAEVSLQIRKTPNAEVGEDFSRVGFMDDGDSADNSVPCTYDNEFTDTVDVQSDNHLTKLPDEGNSEDEGYDVIKTDETAIVLLDDAVAAPTTNMIEDNVCESNLLLQDVHYDYDETKLQLELKNLQNLILRKEGLWREEKVEMQKQHVSEKQNLVVLLKEKEKKLEAMNTMLLNLNISHDELSSSHTKLKDEVEYSRSKLIAYAAENHKEASLTEISKLKLLIAEKDSQIEAYSSEGQALSRKQGEMERIIRNTRQEIRGKESEISKLSDVNSRQQLEIEKLNETISKYETDLNNANKNIAIIQTVSQTSSDKVVKLEVDINTKNTEITTLKKSLEAALCDASNAKKAVADLQVELDDACKRLGEGMNLANMSESYKRDLEQREAVLRATNKHLQDTLQRHITESSSREESMKEELSDMRKRWQEAVTNREKLTTNMGESTKPLLNQISSLQEALRQKEKHWHEIERNLASKVFQAESALVTETDRRTQAENIVVQLNERIDSFERQSVDYQKHIILIEASLNDKKILCDELQGKLEATAVELQHELKRSAELEDRLSSLAIMHKAEIINIRESIEKISAQKSAVVNQLKVEIEELRSHVASPKDILVKDDSSLTVDSSMGDNSANVLLTGKSQQLLQRRNEEIAALRDMVSQLETSRNEIVIESSILREELSRQSETMLKVKNELRLLRQRNDTLLLLVGEKEEELEDATASLREVKLLYRQQIELLVSKNERLIH